MSLEEGRSRNDPEIAIRIREFRKKNQESFLPKTPIEKIAKASLEELSEVENQYKKEPNAIFAEHPIVLAVKNGRFIEKELASLLNLSELLDRTFSRVNIVNDGSIYFGGISTNDKMVEEEDYEEEMRSLCFDDGNFAHRLTDINSFQDCWDQSSPKDRKQIAKFGLMTKVEIIRRFKDFVKPHTHPY